jgi:hypothetical protein
MPSSKKQHDHRVTRPVVAAAALTMFLTRPWISTGNESVQNCTARMKHFAGDRVSSPLIIRDKFRRGEKIFAMSETHQSSREERGVSIMDHLKRGTLPSPMKKLAYTIEEAAQLSSLGQTSIYKAIRNNLLIKRKYGTRTVITDYDLMSFLDNLPIDTK